MATQHERAMQSHDSPLLRFVISVRVTDSSHKGTQKRTIFDAMNKTIALLFIGLVLGINIYLCWRLWRITPGMWAVKAGVVLVYLLWMALFFMSFLRIERLPMGLAYVVYNVGNPWLIFFLYLLIGFLLTGLARICHLIPPTFLKDNLAGLCSIVGGVILLMAIGGIHYHHKYREELTIHTHKQLEKPVNL